MLLERNAWGIVTGTETNVEIDPNRQETTIKEVKDFDSRYRTALEIIYLNVESEYHRIIENIDDPKQAWDTLKTHFQPDNRSSHMQLFSQIIACCMNEDVDMLAFRLELDSPII